MPHLIDKDALVAEIERLKNSEPYYPTLAERYAYNNGVNDAIDKIYSLEVKEVDLELIVGWFEHIAQMADDRKTLNGEVMEDWAALDEIKCLAKNSADFIQRHYKAQKGE